MSRGSEVDGIDVYGDKFNYKLKAKYTDIRIPIIYNFNNPEKISPYIYLAPIFSFTRGGEINYTTYDMNEPMPWPALDMTNANFSKFDFSAAAGVGIRIPVQTQRNCSLLWRLIINMALPILMEVKKKMEVLFL